MRTHTAGLDFDEGLLELEEVEGVQVVYEQMVNGHVAKFLVRTSLVYKSIMPSVICNRWMIRSIRRQMLAPKGMKMNQASRRATHL